MNSNVAEWVVLTRKIDNLKGNWWLWECRIQMADGSFVSGTIQGDTEGNFYDRDSFEADEDEENAKIP